MTSFDYTQYQRDLMLADLADEAVRGGEDLRSVDQNYLKQLREKATSGVDESFLPLDYMPGPEDETLDKIALDDRTKIDLLKSYLDDISEIESSSRSKVFLANQAHFTDLVWIVAELNGALLSFGGSDEDIHHIAARMRLLHLVKEIKAKSGAIK